MTNLFFGNGLASSISVLLSLPTLSLNLIASDVRIQHMAQAWLGNWPSLPTDMASTLRTIPPAPGRDAPHGLKLHPSSPLHPISALPFTWPNRRFWLRLSRRGWVDVPAQPDSTQPLVGWLTPGLLDSGRFEDLFWVAVAPWLRQRGLFLVHGFAAASPDEQQTILLVGRSGSGKTTTGLALLQTGWRWPQPMMWCCSRLRQRGDGSAHAGRCHYRAYKNAGVVCPVCGRIFSPLRRTKGRYRFRR
ncbi:MAG: hypothetical protein IPL78_25960 [Chloroflexi bacterium]|nr:hypothetical protein [Chloroflexota bacterium]